MNNEFNVTDLLIFLWVADHASFTKAARQLGLSKAHVSQAVSRLETHFSTRLMERSTRSLTLTESGTLLLKHARLVNENIENTKSAISQASGELSGLLRIAAPVTMARTFLGPHLHEFLSQHPAIRIAVEITSREIDLFEESIDIQFKVGNPKQQSVVAVELGRSNAILCAASTFLKQPIRKPADLKPLPFVALQIPGDRGELVLTKEKTEYRFEPLAKVICNDPGTAAELIISGAGIGIVPDFLARDHIKSGKLIELLPSWKAGRGVPFFAVYASRKGVTSKTRIFLEWVSRRLVPLMTKETT